MIVDSITMGGSTFPNPAEARYFEDYTPGSVLEFGSVVLELSDILEFSAAFDPQPFHTDPIAAARTPFRGLVASGWQTASAMMRLYVDHFLSKNASLGSPGVNGVRILRPVRPGDSLTIRVSILSARRFARKPGCGLLRNRIEVLNQEREVVMSMRLMEIVRCRRGSAVAT
jgi:acyl dehydratase